MMIQSLVRKCASISDISVFIEPMALQLIHSLCHLVDFSNLICDCSRHPPAGQLLHIVHTVCETSQDKSSGLSSSARLICTHGLYGHPWDFYFFPRKYSKWISVCSSSCDVVAKHSNRI